MRPDFGHIKYVPSVFLCLFGGHDLNISSPTGEVAFRDVLEKVLDIVVGILSGDLGSLCFCEVLDALIRLEMNFNIVE